jgi:acylphosphatase
MELIVAHDNADVRIEVEPEQRLVQLTWKGQVPGAEYRATLMRLHALVEQHGIVRWLSDGRLMGPILYADQAWTMQEFVPLLIQAGMERIAIVSSQDVLNQIAVDRMVSSTPDTVPYAIAFFPDPVAAQAWLLEADPPAKPA